MWQRNAWWMFQPPPRQPPFIACPPAPPRYVIPGSHRLDPFYAQRFGGPPFLVGNFPFPRQPWPFESDTRAPGTGLVPGQQPCPPSSWGR